MDQTFSAGVEGLAAIPHQHLAGRIVDTDALVDALRSGKVAAARCLPCHGPHLQC